MKTSSRPGLSPLARFARQWAPWRVVRVVLLVIAAIHVLWAMGVWWPASSSDALADAVVGRRPFPPSALNLAVAAALTLAVGLVSVSMRSDLPPRLVRLCCLAANVVVVILALRGFFGEIASITDIEGSTTRYRILDIVLFSPICLWAALGIHYRWLTGSR